jgi:hypothetical protein
MERTGEVVALPGVGNKRSLLTALALPARRNWLARDVVWFAEDDYLYSPSALDRLVGAAEPVTVDGHDWHTALATPATSGARVGVIRSDRHVFVWSLATSSTWDYTASLAYQGIVPFPRRRLAADPALCTHLESAHLAQGSDLSTIATETDDWAGIHGIEIDMMR